MFVIIPHQVSSKANAFCFHYFQHKQIVTPVNTRVLPHSGQHLTPGQGGRVSFATMSSKCVIVCNDLFLLFNCSYFFNSIFFQFKFLTKSSRSGMGAEIIPTGIDSVGPIIWSFISLSVCMNGTPKRPQIPVWCCPDRLIFSNSSFHHLF